MDIAESVGFQTKPELARCMLQRVWEAQLPIAWVVADTVYGGKLDLRTWLQSHGYAYVLAVPCNEPVGIVTSDGRRRQVRESVTCQRVLPAARVAAPLDERWVKGSPTLSLGIRADLASVAAGWTALA